MQNSIKLNQFVHKILSGNDEILRITKGYNCFILEKLMRNISNQDLVKINATAKFSLIKSICSHGVEWKRNSYKIKGHNSVVNV